MDQTQGQDERAVRDQIQEANKKPARWSWDAEDTALEMSRSGVAVPKQHSPIDDIGGDLGPSESGSAAGKGSSENILEENRPGDDNQGGADAGEANPGESAPGEDAPGEVDPVEEGRLDNDPNEGEPGNDPAPEPHPDNPERKLCTLCLAPMGRRRDEDGNIEMRMYLPCGHSYGHVCLFGQLFAKESFAICPVEQCALTLRHSCGHLAIPSLEKPERPIRSRILEVLPGLCKYCANGVGYKRREIRTRRI
jgi:hypothetical protein